MNPRALSGCAQAGVSLVETMVALAIGLLVCGAVMTSVMASGRTGRHAQALVQMTDNATAASALLREHVALAGFGQPRAVDASGHISQPLPVRVIFGCDGRFVNPRAAFDQLACAAGSGPGALAILHEANARNTLLSGEELPLDCLGNGIKAEAPDKAATGSAAIFIGDSRFFVSTVSGSRRRELYCKGAGAAAPQPLVEGIEDLQFQFGTAVDGAMVWHRASQVGVLGWPAVAAVQVCLVATSTDEVADAPLAYIDCEGDEVVPIDRRLYRRFFTTVVLPTRVVMP